MTGMLLYPRIIPACPHSERPLCMVVTLHCSVRGMAGSEEGWGGYGEVLVIAYPWKLRRPPIIDLVLKSIVV